MSRRPTGCFHVLLGRTFVFSLRALKLFKSKNLKKIYKLFLNLGYFSSPDTDVAAAIV